MIFWHRGAAGNTVPYPIPHPHRSARQIPRHATPTFSEGQLPCNSIIIPPQCSFLEWQLPCHTIIIPLHRSEEAIVEATAVLLQLQCCCCCRRRRHQRRRRLCCRCCCCGNTNHHAFNGWPPSNREVSGRPWHSQ